MIALAAPWALVLAIPAAAAWWWLVRQGYGRWWRLALLALLVAAAARPQWTRDDGGSDVVLVLDRSASMGEAVRQQDELVRLAGESRRRGDRLAVVAFAVTPAVAQGPQASGVPRLGDVQIDPQGSDLDAALDAAAALCAPGRTTRIVLASDGEATAADPRRAAVRLAGQGVLVDVLPERREAGADAAIMDLELPGSLHQGESFLGALVLVSDRPERRAWRVSRAGRVIASGTAQLNPGRPLSVAFADRPAQPGLAPYVAELDATGDRQSANNRAAGWVRVTTGERVLVVGGDGSEGNISRAIRAAGIDVATRAAGPLGLADLLGCQTLVLANTPAGSIGHAGMQAIARWVQHLGGGLVMTGGAASFGCGGWYRSPVEPILPVSLEVRDEHRILTVAMAIAIDRSGSMAAQTADGRQKIELAAEGAAAAIELLGPRDRIAVFAVDTAPHEVLPMTRVENPRRLAAEVIGMQSQGGGIYIYQALAAAGAELLKTDAGTRHLLLFADASDSEEPEGYIKLLAAYRSHGITVSVVGMGSDRDCHADLLIDVAKRGGGRIAFAEDPADIPRLFAQETVLVARNPWVEQAVAPTPVVGALGALLGIRDGALTTAWPQIPGYNLTYPRPRAEVLAWCPGDPRAPAAAAWQVGSGRAVALPFPCDAADAATVPAWAGYAPLLASCARWAAGGGEAAPGAIIARRRGGLAEIRLELDPAREAEWPAGAPLLHLVSDDPAVPTRPVLLNPIDRGTWVAEIPLAAGPPILPVADLGGRSVIGSPLCAPMPAEVAPRRDLPAGDLVLTDIAATTGGRLRHDLLGIYDNPPSPGTARELAPWLVAAALLALLVEVGVRRMRFTLGLPRLPRLRWPRRQTQTPVEVPKPEWLAGRGLGRGGGAASGMPPGEPIVTAPPPAPAPAPPPATVPGSTHQAMDELRKRR